MSISKKRVTKKLVKKRTQKRRHKNEKRKRRSRHQFMKFNFFGGQENEEECPICSESLKNGATFETNCKHKFHLRCIQQWCNRTQSTCTCPICRAPIIPKPTSTSQDIQDIIYKISFSRISQDSRSGRMISLQVGLNNIDRETATYLKHRLLFSYPGIEVDFNGRVAYAIIPEGELNETNPDLIDLEEDTRNNTLDIVIDVEPEDDVFERYIVKLTRER